MKIVNTHNFNGRGKQRGIALVEFVIAAPVVIFIALAVAELGNAMMQYNTMTQSLRDGARHLAAIAGKGSTGVVSLTAADQLEVSNLVAYGTRVAGTPVIPGLNASEVVIQNLGNGLLSIEVSHNYDPILIGGLPRVYSPGSGGSVNTALNMRSEMVVRAL